jgi:hypothetical protein
LLSAGLRTFLLLLCLGEINILTGIVGRHQWLKRSAEPNPQFVGVDTEIIG